jgi:DmsE family decaheme c-type cytochrome
MGRKLSAVLGVIAGVALVLVAVILLAFPTSAPAQKAAAPPAGTPAELPPGYVGAETCKGCHAEQFEKFTHTKMGRLFLHQPRNSTEGLACESCHGPGKAHADAGGGKGVGGMITFARNDKTPVDKRNAICLSCHTKGNRVFWQGSAHESRSVACTSCHKIMEEVSPKNQLAKETVADTCGTCHVQKLATLMRSAHMPLAVPNTTGGGLIKDFKMTCTSCHNPHGTTTPSLLKEISLNATCYTCHAEKRGPFLWTHAPVQESCANCHDPHGSNHESMLKISKPRLCQQCHVPTQHPTRPYGRDTGSLKFVLGRSCTDCHANIHGSNHPAGFAFTR